MGHKGMIGFLIATYLIGISFTAYLFMVYTSIISTRENIRSPVSLQPTVSDLNTIYLLLELSSRGEFPGTVKTRPGRRGPIPIWSQRTAILYYNRKIVGDHLRWLSISMGVVGNSKELISNKKLLRSVWKKSNPVIFSEMERYLPKTWSDRSSFDEDFNYENTYVYKPVLGSGGNGILFKRGGDMSRLIRYQDKRSWVIQEFIDPYLYNNKKTHMRCITLVIIQPDGTREFFMYDKMRIFTAAEEFDNERLLEERDNSFMLLTNMHQNKIHFKEDPRNAKTKFTPSMCIFDAESSMKDTTGATSFDSVYSSTMNMHSLIYSIIGTLIECVPTDVSIYDKSCFHMMASDIAVDKNGKPYFLEMNNAMGYNAWSSDEISSFSRGAASLVKGIGTMYDIEDTSMWKKI